MQKWEHIEVIHEISYETGTAIEKIFANGRMVGNGDFFGYVMDLGQEGWELVSTHLRRKIELSSDVYYFKRPIE